MDKITVIVLVVNLILISQQTTSRRLSKRFLYGENAKQHAWPWQALMITGPKDYNICSGSLITNEWVLTAAHCVRFDDAPSYKLVFGEHIIGKKDGTEVYRDIAEVIKNPNYEMQNHSNDIALLKLKTPIDLSAHKHISTIKLNLKEINLEDRHCVGSGWGRKGLSGRMPKHLKQMDLKIFDHEKCAKIHHDWYAYEESKEEVTEKQFCMVSSRNKYPTNGVSYGGACGGDSGGPLQCLDDDKKTWLLVGVTWSATDCYQNPTVYQWVHKYKDFILKTVGKDVL